MEKQRRRIDFTCAVCPNGCQLAVELDEKDNLFLLESGRCVRGNLLIGKSWYFDGEGLVKLSEPMSKRQIAELVEKRKKLTCTL
ncbi:MAG: hypothetical protein IKU44_00100 [Firmicutes bacterium]|nr:hypothetical protein [Bacillota bacterium]